MFNENLYILFEFEIALRLYKSKKGEKRISKPAVIIAVAGIAIGLIIMILTLAIMIGFKSNIKHTISGFSSDIVLTNYNSVASIEGNPIAVSSTMLEDLKQMKDIEHVQRYSSSIGIVKTDESFEGILLKGVGQEYDTSFYREALVEGRLPQFNDSVSTNEVMLSKMLADRLKINLEDKIYTYFTEKKSIKARRLTVVGIYQTNYYEFDKAYLITDLHLLTRLNKWNADQFSGVEIKKAANADLEDLTYTLSDIYSGTIDKYDEPYIVLNVEDLNGSLFGWLELLDMNLWVILVLMMVISGFTIISGLLILILERTQMIGLLKGLGATNGSVRKIFIWLASFLVLKGVVIGNVVGLTLCLLQSKLGLIRLDPLVYYIDRVPISVSLWWVLLLNISVIAIAVVMLIGPSYIISKINPATSMRYE